MGKEYDGIHHRTTFVIDENGIIIEVIEKVKKEHAEQILK
jgi:peroxiredoxin Q/BCP